MQIVYFYYRAKVNGLLGVKLIPSFLPSLFLILNLNFVPGKIGVQVCFF